MNRPWPQSKSLKLQDHHFASNRISYITLRNEYTSLMNYVKCNKFQRCFVVFAHDPLWRLSPSIDVIVIKGHYYKSSLCWIPVEVMRYSLAAVSVGAVVHLLAQHRLFHYIFRWKSEISFLPQIHRWYFSFLFFFLLFFNHPWKIESHNDFGY